MTLNGTTARRPAAATTLRGLRDPVAVVVARAGALPLGAAEAAAEAGGAVLVVGSGAEEAAGRLTAERTAQRVWWADTGAGLRVGALTAALTGLLADVPLLVLPNSPDGRDLAPRLAAALDRPLLAHAIRVDCATLDGAPRIRAELSRVDDRVLVAVEHRGPAVATLVPGVRSPATYGSAVPVRIELPEVEFPDVTVLEVLEPDPATMDLAEAPRVVGGGAGLVPAGTDDVAARAIFALLAAVAARLGASAGATRVVTDAGWLGYDRQIGTTGVTVNPGLYLALGVSGAGQHTGGLGAPDHIVSVNTDGSSPMTAMADLGLVTDALALLVELARRLDVPIPTEVPGA